MTQPVADKTPIPERIYRRHIDPPSLWIAVTLSSAILHLLLFWLLRSHGFNLSQKNSSNPVPIEFITIPAEQTPTKASPKQPSSVTPPKQVAPKTSAAKSSPVEDNRAIAFTDTPPTSINENVKPKNPKPQPKKVVVKPEPKFQPDPKPTNPIPLQTQAPEPTSSPEIPQNEQPESTPSPSITETPEPTPSSSPSVEDITSPSPSPTETNSLPDNLPKTEGEVAVGKETPLEDLAPPVQPQQSPTTPQQGGIGIASWEIETGNVQKDTLENLAQPKEKSQPKELELNMTSEEELTPGLITFQASLLIDSDGNLTDVYIPPSISEPQSSRYREYARELFKDQKFIPGKKRPLSTLVVRITIQPVTSNQ